MPGEPERPRVLLVDDEAANLETFARVFRKDFSLRMASSVAQAAEILASGATFDVALVDYAMPGENGVALLGRATQLAPAMARLLLTAHGDVAEVKQAVAAKLAHGLILKPWTRETILRWVAQARQLGDLRKSVRLLKSSLDKG